MYKPQIIKGMVKGTGWPIDGHVLTFGLWDYDNKSSYHLYTWDDADDEAVMKTMYLTLVDGGFEEPGRLAEFAEEWKAGKFDAPGPFCLDLNKVEVCAECGKAMKLDAAD